ncbi:hypothetical protein MMC13_007324 [Lambiella insularis]|nr:hypothetical protein [Lambiella insularis]
MSSGEGTVAFEDFDSKSVFRKCQAAILSKETRNFVLEFNNADAYCALDVDSAGVRQLLDSKTIAEHYSFSPRLLGLMRCTPLTPVLVPSTLPHGRLDFWHSSKGHVSIRHADARDAEKVIQDKSLDLEGHHDGDKHPATESQAIDLNHYTIVNEVWHYASVDWGHKYLCIGYNSLFNTAASLTLDPDSSRKSQNRPAGKRVWMWLVLCNDGTVISIHENAFPKHDAPLNNEEQKDLKAIRRNLSNVFCQISNANEVKTLQNPIETLPIRSPSLKKDGQPHALPADIPSLLFYYLFDDWYTSYSLVARREHQYGTKLEKLRAGMFTTADLKHIDDLHHYGRQLAVLKRIYESYNNIIERVLDGPKQIEYGKASSNNEPVEPREASESSEHSDVAISTSIGVPLSTTARVRFERLKDRITLYALSEIKDCIDEKDALVLLNFNLIAIKESSAVESLTRITILLAKVTILFLPVSLMTAYFTVQLSDIGGPYTVATYWASFAVLMALSFIFLLVFGKLSGTQESKPIYQSLTKVFFNKIFRSQSKSQSRPKEKNMP